MPIGAAFRLEPGKYASARKKRFNACQQGDLPIKVKHDLRALVNRVLNEPEFILPEVAFRGEHLDAAFSMKNTSKRFITLTQEVCQVQPHLPFSCFAYQCRFGQMMARCEASLKYMTDECIELRSAKQGQ